MGVPDGLADDWEPWTSLQHSEDRARQELVQEYKRDLKCVVGCTQFASRELVARGKLVRMALSAFRGWRRQLVFFTTQVGSTLTDRCLCYGPNWGPDGMGYNILPHLERWAVEPCRPHM